MDKLKGLDLEGKLVLDAGTGACNMTKFLENWGARVVSVDIQRDWQAECREETDKTEFITGDLSDMDFFDDDVFDYVICNFVVSALSQTKELLLSAAFREFYRVLKPEGMLVIIDYYPFEGDRCPSPCDLLQVKLWRLENAVAELLGQGHLEEYHPNILESELLALGFNETDNSVLLENVPWPDDLIADHEATILEKIESLDEDYLKDALKLKLGNIISSAKGKKIESGAIYELRALK